MLKSQLLAPVNVTLFRKCFCKYNQLKIQHTVLEETLNSVVDEFHFSSYEGDKTRVTAETGIGVI